MESSKLSEPFKLHKTVDFSCDVINYDRRIGKHHTRCSIACHEANNDLHVHEMIRSMDCNLVQSIGLDVIIEEVQKQCHDEHEQTKHRLIDQVIQLQQTCIQLKTELLKPFWRKAYEAIKNWKLWK